MSKVYIFNHRGRLILRKAGVDTFALNRTVMLEKGMNVVSEDEYKLLNKDYIDALVSDDVITVTKTDAPVAEKAPKRKKGQGKVIKDIIKE